MQLKKAGVAGGLFMLAMTMLFINTPPGSSTGAPGGTNAGENSPGEIGPGSPTDGRAASGPAPDSSQAHSAPESDFYNLRTHGDVLRLKSAAAGGDVDAFVRLEGERSACLFAAANYDSFKPSSRSVMEAPWIKLVSELRERCRTLQIDSLDRREFNSIRQRIEHAARVTNHPQAIPDGLVSVHEVASAQDEAHMRIAWDAAADSNGPVALIASLRAAIPNRDPLQANEVRRAVQDAGVHEEDPVLQQLNAHVPALAACVKFGHCQLPKDRLAALCIVDHACFGNLPLPELLNGRIMSSADYYKLQAIVAALLAQLDRPGG